MMLISIYTPVISLITRHLPFKHGGHMNTLQASEWNAYSSLTFQIIKIPSKIFFSITTMTSPFAKMPLMPCQS